MTRIGKFVGALVVLSLLAMPAGALVSLWAPAMMSSDCPLCPAMMHRNLDSTMVQETPATPSCCDVSSSKPVPASVLQAPTTAAVLAPPTNAILAVVTTPAGVDHFSDQVPISPPTSPQAVLCTFLI